jgi:hypothetical protein
MPGFGKVARISVGGVSVEVTLEPVPLPLAEKKALAELTRASAPNVPMNRMKRNFVKREPMKCEE